jgi:hypothetical protein
MTTFPLYLWIAGGILFLFSIFLSYLLLFDLEPHQKNKFSIFLNILLYYLGFYLFYSGKIEFLIINRKVRLF